MQLLHRWSTRLRTSWLGQRFTHGHRTFGIFQTVVLATCLLQQSVLILHEALLWCE